MKLTALVLIAACHAGTAEDYPVRGGGGGVSGGGGGGGGSGSGSGSDAGSDGADPDGGVPITGRVCLITDLRRLTVCSPTGASGLTVSLGTRATTTTSGDGAFSFTAQLGDSFVWRVTSAVADRIITSVIPFGPDYSLPVIATAVYVDLQNANQVQLADQQGAIVVRVVQGTASVSGVTVSSPAATPPILYDGISKLDWDQLQTGALGVAWLPIVALANTPPTTAVVTLTPSGATASIIARVPVENQAITFVTKDIK
jgi:hypothetical protein